MPIGPGSRIGPYEITALIGEGGMGKVWRAHHTALKRDDALKVLPDAVASDPERLARFQREAQVLASLNHPNIAHVYGLERTDSGHALVMELVEGPTLADRIAEGPIPVDEALPYARQIAEALEAAHEQGIVHRDLKPANIKVRPDGVVKVLDFGLAKALQPSSAGHTDVTASPTITSPAMMTNAGVILGTAAYMSPEQARGKAVDRRTDIWAFGCVLYEMLTGRRAFAGDEVSDVLASVLVREPDWTLLPRELSPVLVAFIKRCLHKDRKQRIGDAQSVRLALEGAFGTGATPAPGSVVHRPFWRRALPVTVASLATAVIVGGIAWSLRPAASPPKVSRFEYVLPEGQPLRGGVRPVMAISRDGRHFVYNTSDGLYLRAMGEIEPRLIPGTEAPLGNPFFSPDGQSIGFFQDNQLKRIPISGGTAANICACAAPQPLGASWALNDVILFAQPAGIMRVSANGGTPELVIPAKDGEQLYGPQLLPDGDAVLFSVATGTGADRWDRGQVVVQSLSSAKRTLVVQGGSDARYLSSGHLVYALQNALFGVPFDAGRLATTGGAVSLVQGVQRSTGFNVTAAAHYAVSDEGTLVYISDTEAVRSMVWVDRRGAPAEPIASIPPGAYESPRLSSDGARVVASRDGDIWIYDVASGRSSRLTTDGVSQMAVWNPTGSQIAYTSDRGGNAEAWIGPSDGSGEPRQVTRLGGVVHVDSWSPDGRTLAIHHHPPQGPVSMQMVSMEAPAAKPQFFLQRGFSNEAATFSPDGRYVAYASSETGQNEIYIRPFPGPGGQETVSVGGGREPVWTKSGGLFYRSLTGERMMAVPVTAQPALKVGQPLQLFEGPYFISPTGSLRPQYDVTADGQRFLMLAAGPATDGSGNRPRIVVVQNWTEELKRLAPTR
jgi:Tol biopolymer transport system component